MNATREEASESMNFVHEATCDPSITDFSIPVLPGMVVLGIITENSTSEIQLLAGVFQPFHNHFAVVPANSADVTEIHTNNMNEVKADNCIL